MENSSVARAIEGLRTQGLEAGRRAAAELMEQARGDAAALLEQARAEAASTLAAAEADAQVRRERLAAELRGALAAGVEEFRLALEATLLLPTVDDAVASVLDDPTNVTVLLTEVARAFAGAAGGGATVVLGAAHRELLDEAVRGRVLAELGDGITLRVGSGRGFFVALTDEGYRFDCTEQALREVLAGWLSPGFRAALFAGATS